MKQLNHISSKKRAKKVLFLGSKKCLLIELFIAKDYAVFHTSDIIYGTKGFDLVILYEYAASFNPDLIQKALCPIVNLDADTFPDLPKEILIWDKDIREGFENIKALAALKTFNKGMKEIARGW